MATLRAFSAIIAASLTLTVPVAPAAAALLGIDFSGHVTAADAGNVYGLGAGDTVTGRLVYDDPADVLPAEECLGITPTNPDIECVFYPQSLTTTIGTRTFSQAEADQWLDQRLLNGQLIGISFDVLTQFGDRIFYTNYIGTPNNQKIWFANDYTYGQGSEILSNRRVEGVWDLPAGPGTSVPEPASTPLAAFALLTALWLRTKKGPRVLARGLSYKGRLTEVTWARQPRGLASSHAAMQRSKRSVNFISNSTSTV